MKLNEVIKSAPTSNAAIKNTASIKPIDGWYPAYSASGQDVWLPDCRFDRDGLVVSAVGARCGKVFKADGKWNVCANTHSLFVDESKVLRDYCWYMINDENWWVKGGTAQPFVKVKDSLNREHDFPTLTKQESIVKVLDQVQTLIQQKKSQIQKLDTLVKAQFVEMFGSINYRHASLKDITELITKGTTPTTLGYKFVDEGVNFVKIESITDDYTINHAKVAHVDSECHQAFKRSQLKSGDILFSIAGAIGKMAIISDKDLPGNTNQALAIIRLPMRSIVSQLYLVYALGMPAAIEQCAKKKRGVAQMNLSLQDIGNIEVAIPDESSQKNFATFVHQVDKSKFCGA